MTSSFLKLFWKAVKALNTRERLAALIFVAIFGFGTVGFGWSVASYFKPETTVVKQGGVYSEGLVGSLKSLNPLFADFSNVDRSITRLMFSGLTKYDPLTKSFVADLATYELDDKKTKYTFTMREGVKWHDGEPLTVDDVVFTYKDVIQNEEFPNSVLRANFAGIEIKKENESQVSFTLDEPNTFFITNTNIGILPKHLYKEVVVAEIAQADIKPVGSGPYMLAGTPERTDEEIVVSLERFADYYNEAPKIEKVRFKIYPFRDLLVENLSHLHAVEKLSESDLENIKDKDRFELYPFELPQYMAVFFNFDSPLMKNKQMRIAAMKAVDREEILETIKGKAPVDNPLLDLAQDEWFYKHDLSESQGALYGLGWRLPSKSTPKPTPTPSPSASPAAASDAADTTSTSSTTAIASAKPSPSPTIEATATATPEAEPVDEDELPTESQIRVNKKGEKLVLRLIAQELPTGNKAQVEQEKLIELLKKHWAAAGIEVRDEYYILPEIQDRIKEGDYDMLLFGVNMGYNLDIYANWHSSQAGENGLNFSKYKSFEADALIENIRQTFEASPENEDQLKKLRKVIADDFPAVFLYTPKYYYGADKRIQGIDIRNLSFSADRFAYFDKWYINE